METLLMVLAGLVLLVAAFNPWALVVIVLDLLGLRLQPRCQGCGVDMGTHPEPGPGSRGRDRTGNEGSD